MTTDADIPGAIHSELVLYPVRPGARNVYLRALTGQMVFTPTEARQLAADLLNRADAIDPPGEDQP